MSGYFRRKTSRQSCPEMMKVGVLDWGAHAAPSPGRYDARVCSYARQVLRQIWWGRQTDRDGCQSFLGDTSALGIRNDSNEGMSKGESPSVEVRFSPHSLAGACYERGVIARFGSK